MRTALRPMAAVVIMLTALAGLTTPATRVAAGTLGPSITVEQAADAPTRLVLSAEPADLTYGGTTVLAGRLTDPATGSGIVGAPVHLEVLHPDGVWREVAQLSTDGGGSVSGVQTPDSTTTYRLRFGVPGAPDASTSSELPVRLHEVTAGLGEDAVRAGRPVTVSGAVRAVGHPVAVRLERRSSGTWRPVARTRSAVDGTYSLTVTPDVPGNWTLRVVRAADGTTVQLPTLDVFRLHRYTVVKRGTVRADMSEFRASVAATYADPRGWLGAHHRFRYVEGPGGRPDFTVVLSQARYLPAFSWTCSSTYSCRVGRHVIINQDRWRRGSPHFPGTLEQYRRMVVNHETGHWLGRGHDYCGGSGRLAPVMQQQSKGMHGCRVNPWPLEREIRSVS